MSDWAMSYKAGSCDGGGGGCSTCITESENTKRLREDSIKAIENLFRRDRKLKPLIKSVRGGFELLNYYTSVLDAMAKIPTPSGVYPDFSISNTNKKRIKDIKVLRWLFAAIEKQLKTEGKRKK
jgi:hypothetical protein